MKLWHQPEAGREWAAVEIPPEGLAICGGPQPRFAAGSSRPAGASALLVPFQERGAAARAVLVSSPRSARALLVNGYPPLPAALIEHATEITFAGARLLVSLVGVAERQRLPEGAPPTRCARCTAELHAGDSVVRCPGCGGFFHEADPADAGAEARNCWSYADTCVCGRRRDEFAAAPGELDD